MESKTSRVAAIIHKNQNYLYELAPIWIHLTKQCSEATVFQNYYWVMSWWEKHRDTLTAYIVEVKKNGETVCIIPLCSSARDFGPLRIRNLRFMGYDTSDYLLPILADHVDRTEILESAFACMMKDKYSWDHLDFADLPEGSALDVYLQTKNGKHGFVAIVSPYKTPCPYLFMEPDWSSVEQKFAHAHSKNIAYNIRRLTNRVGGLQFNIVNSKDQIVPVMNELFVLHCKRWRNSESPSKFTNQSERDYYIQLAHALWDSGQLHLTYLCANDRVIGIIFGMVDGSRMYYHTPAHDPDYHMFSPGKLIIYYTLLDCHSKGYRVFDFMRGGYDFKKQWGTASAYNMKWGLYNHSAKAKFIQFLFGIKSKLPRKSNLKPSAFALASDTCKGVLF
jgi:CelD/BcsL family acetyltransferase involved in cellulose biosynthesis